MNGIPQKISYLFELCRGFLYRSYYQFLYRGTYIGKKFRVGKSVSFNLWGNHQLKIQDYCYFRDFCRIQIENGNLSIGNNTFFNNFCTINCLYKVEIGDNCLFGESVKIYDHNHKYQDDTKFIKDQGFSYGEISIGSNCWIGSNVVILKDVKIGNNVVIGANTIIFKDVPSNSIVKGQRPTIEILDKEST